MKNISKNTLKSRAGRDVNIDLFYLAADVDYLLQTDDPATDWEWELANLERRIRHFQHERLILLITISAIGISILIAGLFLLTVMPDSRWGTLQPMPVIIVLGLLSAGFLLKFPQYLKLRNGVSALYDRTNSMAWRIQGCPDPSRAFYSRPGSPENDNKTR